MIKNLPKGEQGSLCLKVRKMLQKMPDDYPNTCKMKKYRWN